MWYGVSWYPEQKTREEFEHDLKLLVESGINVVRMTDFAWSSLEPQEGRFNFDWLDKAVDRLGKEGIQSVICTPTASNPAWLSEKHPEIHYVDNRGVVRPFGARRNYCYNNFVYREYSRKIAGEIARRYGHNPYILGFQIDNELAQEGTGRCHCNVCRNKFHNWLEAKYGTINELNKKLGMVFWGHEYNNFKQINLPLRMIEPGTQEEIVSYFDNPSLRLDFERFCSESNIEYQNVQLEEMRKYTSKVITTNSTGTGTNSINYYESYKALDKYACDAYPNLREGVISSAEYAFSRAIKEGDQRFWVLEFSAGGGHALWGKEGRLQPFPGALKQAALHAFASGAELLAHFQFRTYPYGAEQLNYAVVDMDGVPGRRYYELKQAAEELGKLEEALKESYIQNQVAICFDYDAMWALKIKPIHRDFDYVGFVREIYDSLKKQGIGADIIPFDADFAEYKLLILTSPFVMKDEIKSKLKEYVNQGGNIIGTFLTAVKTPYNTGVTQSLPGGLTDLFGIRVKEVEPVFESSQGKIDLNCSDQLFRGVNRYWVDVLESLGADIIGTFADTFRQGEGVVSRNTFGKGAAWYLGTGLEGALLDKLLQMIAIEAKVERCLISHQCDGDIEIIHRRYRDRDMFCIFNFKPEAVKIELDKAYTDLLTDKTVKHSMDLPARGYAFLTSSLS